MNPLLLAAAVLWRLFYTLALPAIVGVGLFVYAMERLDKRERVMRFVAGRPSRCECGCGADWHPTDTDEYLTSHFECEGCGLDYRMELVRFLYDRDENGRTIPQPVLACPYCAAY